MTTSSRSTRLGIAAGSALILAAAALGGASPALATLTISANVNGAAVVPGPGDEDGAGTASPLFRLDEEDAANNRACVFFQVADVDPITVAEVGLGDPGEAGTIVATIPVEDFGGDGSGCIDGVDSAVVNAFNADPTAYFVQLDNDAFPAGAVRGQVEVGAVISVSVHEYVCPGSIRKPADVLAAPAGTCTVAARTGDIGSPPPGFSWSPKPTEFDMQVTLQTDFGTLTLDQADQDGGGTCGGKTCTPGRFYTWFEQAPGPMTITAVTVPKGYKFGWATVGPVTEGDPSPDGTVDVAHRSVSFDMTSFGAADGVSISIYHFRGH